MFRLVSAFLLLAGSALGQGTHASSASDFTWFSQGGAVHGAVAFHGADVRFDGAPVKGRPYSAEALTETTQTLSDGNRITRTNRTMIYRDSAGRTRREETIQGIGPWATADEPRTVIFIHDPVEGTHYVLHPHDRTGRKMPLPKLHESFPDLARDDQKSAFEDQMKHNRFVHADTVAITADGTAGSFEAPESRKLESRIIEGVQAEGTRATLTIPAGEIGNERPIKIISERWFSPELGVELLTTRDDPRMGTTTYRLQDIQRSEPPLTMFVPPDDYEIAEGDPFADRVIRIRRRSPEGGSDSATIDAVDLDVEAEIVQDPHRDR